MHFTDTHTHLDGEEFRNDLPDVISRAKAAGVARVLIPAVDLSSIDGIIALCNTYKGYAFPMIGLHPEAVKSDWKEQLSLLKARFHDARFIAVGEIGLDFYWDRTY